MKLATGVDLIEIARIEEVIARHGKHYLERIYTPAELVQCGKRMDRWQGGLPQRKPPQKLSVAALAMSHGRRSRF